MNDQDTRRVDALRTVAEKRIANVAQANYPNAYVAASPKDLVWLAEQAAPHASADDAQKVADLRNGGAGADNNREDDEVHLRATDLLFLCDLVETAPSHD